MSFRRSGYYLVVSFVFLDFAVVLEEGSLGEVNVLVEFFDLEDFEVIFGIDRRCSRIEVYSRVSVVRARVSSRGFVGVVIGRGRRGAVGREGRVELGRGVGFVE